MNYFDYKPKNQMGKIWGLFQRLALLSEEDILAANRHDYSHTLDIILSALSGNIPLEDEDIESFNLSAYEARCRINDKHTLRANTDKEIYIVDSGVNEGEAGDRVGFGDIAERNLPHRQDDFEVVLSSESIMENLNFLCSLRNEYIIKEGVDILELLKSSLIGIRDATGKLVGLAKKDIRLSTTLLWLCDDSGIEPGELMQKVAARC